MIRTEMFSIKVFLTIGLLTLPAQWGLAKEYFVSPKGSDGNAGTINKPFKSIEKGLEKAAAGDVVSIRAGRYPEVISLKKSGTKGSPIVIQAYKNEKVIVDGTDEVKNVLTWETGKVMFTHEDFGEQLYINDTPMVEARWPNMKFRENWIPEKKWAFANLDGTEHGSLLCAQLMELSHLDLKGAILNMKVYAGAFYSKKIIGFTNSTPNPAGKKDELLYEAIDEIGGMRNKVASHAGGYSPYFYLTGKLNLLDQPEEFFFDKKNKKVYFYPPSTYQKRKDVIRAKNKTRRFGLMGRGIKHVEVRGIQFFSTSGSLKACAHMVIEGCSFIYIEETGFVIHDKYRPKNYVHFEGSHLTVENCEVSQAPYEGLYVGGPGNLVKNNLVHNVGMNGIMNAGALFVAGNKGPSGDKTPTLLENNTVYNVGGAAAYTSGSVNVHFIRNHIFNAGLYCYDVTGHYVPHGGGMDGNIIAYNWVHHIRGGGIRIDRMGKNSLVHHNVVWNARYGIDLQGPPRHTKIFAYNNTSAVLKDAAAFHLSDDSKDGGSMEDDELINAQKDIQARWPFKNNLVFDSIWLLHSPREVSKVQRLKIPKHVRMKDNEGAFSHNLMYNKDNLTKVFRRFDDYTVLDLRLADGSPAIDTGTTVKDITIDVKGKAPDLGAYEYGGTLWVPGKTENGKPLFEDFQQASAFADKIAPRNGKINWLASKEEEVASYIEDVQKPKIKELLLNYKYKSNITSPVVSYQGTSLIDGFSSRDSKLKNKLTYKEGNSVYMKLAVARGADRREKIALASEQIKVEPGKLYEILFDVKIPDDIECSEIRFHRPANSGLQLGAQCFQGNKPLGGSSTLAEKISIRYIAKTGNQWGRVKARFITKDAADSIKIRIFLHSGGTVIFKNILLHKVNDQREFPDSLIANGDFDIHEEGDDRLYNFGNSGRIISKEQSQSGKNSIKMTGKTRVTSSFFKILSSTKYKLQYSYYVSPGTTAKVKVYFDLLDMKNRISKENTLANQPPHEIDTSKTGKWITKTATFTTMEKKLAHIPTGIFYMKGHGGKGAIYIDDVKLTKVVD